MIDRLDFFENNPISRESGNRKVKVGGGFLSIKGRGIIRIYFNIFKIRFANTFYVLRLGVNLLFTIKLYRKGYIGIFDYREFTVFFICQSDKSIMKAKKLDNESLFTVIWVLNEFTEEAFANFK